MKKGLVLLLAVLFGGSMMMVAGCAPKQEATETAPAVEEAAPAVEEAAPATGEVAPATEEAAPAAEEGAGTTE